MIVLSASNAGFLVHGTGQSDGSATSLGLTLSVPTNGLVIVSAIRAVASSITLNGVQAQAINQSIGGYQIALGYSNRLSTQSLGVNYVSSVAAMSVISGSTRSQG